jgi:hypothetical protein
MCKGKGKGHPITGHEGPEEYSYSSTLSLTSALEGVGWSTPRPGRFTRGKEPVPIVLCRAACDTPQGTQYTHHNTETHAATTLQNL